MNANKLRLQIFVAVASLFASSTLAEPNAVAPAFMLLGQQAKSGRSFLPERAGEPVQSTQRYNDLFMCYRLIKGASLLDEISEEKKERYDKASAGLYEAFFDEGTALGKTAEEIEADALAMVHHPPTRWPPSKDRGDKLVAFCRAGKYEELGLRYYNKSH